MLLGKLRTAITCSAFFGLLAAAPGTAFADRGGGSIRAAARSGPEPRSAPESRGPARIEPSRAPVEVRTPPPSHVDVPVRRDWDDKDEDTRHGGGLVPGEPVRAVRGQRVHDLPHHVSITYNHQNYVYDDAGNYYQQQGDDYVVVLPPIGAPVAALPPGVVTVVAGPTTYYFLDGVFYVAQNNSFAVVSPPAGIIVPDLPSGANQAIVNGTVCYQFNGFNYQPSLQGGVTVYVVTPS